jgi:hypothetical protein
MFGEKNYLDTFHYAAQKEKKKEKMIMKMLIQCHSFEHLYYYMTHLRLQLSYKEGL